MNYIDLYRDSGISERSRSSMYKLEKYCQQRVVKDRNHLGGSTGGSSKQIRNGIRAIHWMRVESQSRSRSKFLNDIELGPTVLFAVAYLVE